MDSDSPSRSISVLFLCMGNACRSPMADFYFKNIVNNYGISNLFKISSAAVADEELKKDFCVGTKKQLDKWHIPYHKRAPVKFKKEDCVNYDYIICMDDKIRALAIKIGGKSIENKLYRLLDFSNTPMDIVDPAETNNFDRTYKEVSNGCDAFLNYIISEKHLKKLLIA